MAEQEPKQSGFDNSWAAWKDRLGIGAVLLSLVMLLFFMLTDASLNPQCSVTEYFMMKCNRLDRKFVPWDELEKKRSGSSHVPMKKSRDGKMMAFRFNVHAQT